MTVSIRITGLDKVQRMLGTDFVPVMKAATQAIAEQVRHEIQPYPKATIANSPSNPTGRWYERHWGTKRRLKSGVVVGRKTSRILDQSWGIKASGRIGHVLGTRGVPYAPFLHSEKRQARWAGQRGWVTDKDAIERVIRSGRVTRIMKYAILDALRRR